MYLSVTMPCILKTPEISQPLGPRELLSNCGLLPTFTTELSSTFQLEVNENKGSFSLSMPLYLSLKFYPQTLAGSMAPG